MHMSEPRKGRLSKERREEITRRVMSGERAADLGREFGVTRAYVSLLKAYVLHPQRYVLKAQKRFSRKLTPNELHQFEAALASGTPETFKLKPTSWHWTLDHAFQLAWKLFKKRPSLRVVKLCLAPYLRGPRGRVMKRRLARSSATSAR